MRLHELAWWIDPEWPMDDEPLDKELEIRMAKAILERLHDE